MSLGKIRTLRWAAPLLIAAGMSSVGCKSGMKFPGAGMFGWNREPSAETLTSNVNSPKLPESPANKYTPTALASNSAVKPTGTATAPTNPYGATTPYGAVGSYGSPTSAANANGYQTGPYSTTSAYNPTATTGGATPLASNTSTRGTVGGTYSGNAGLINPAQPPAVSNPTYSGSTSLSPSIAANRIQPPTQPAMSTPSFPQNIGSPSGTVGTLAGAVSTPAAYPAPTGMSQPPTMASGYSMPNTVGTQVTSIPNHVQPSASPISPTQTIPAGYPSSGNAGWANTIPAAAQTSVPTQNSPLLGQTQPNPSGLPSMSPATAVGTAGSNVTTITTSSYRPGTTGRATTYNFGNGTPATSPAGSPLPTYGQPATTTSTPGIMPSAPSTTSPALNYGTGTSLPPNTAYGSGPGLTSPAPSGTMYR